MGKIKITLPLILSVFLFTLLILLLILVSIGFQNSNAGQNFNQDIEKTSEKSFLPRSGQTGENEDTDSDGGIFDSQPITITSCSDAMETLPSPRSPKQRIYPHGNSMSLEVVCDFDVDGGGWTVIQNQSAGPRQEFNRTWNEYVQGFGSLSGNFWLGLENIHALTKNGDQELRIQLEDFEGEKRFAKYSNFSISDASDFYRLTISGFSRTSSVRDSMTGSHSNNGARFTTWDKDNDVWYGNCAQNYAGSWWFSSGCGYSTLNGIYREKGETARGIMWYTWKSTNPLAKTEMKIRKKKSV